MNIDLIEKHSGTVPAEMIIALTDRALTEELRHIAIDLCKESQSREFGHWLIKLCRQELQRRNSDGEIEPSSWDIPMLPPDQLASALLITNLYSYGPTCESLGKFFDHLHAIFIYQCRNYLRAIQ